MQAEVGRALATLQGMANTFWALLPNIVLALIVFGLFWLAGRGVRTLVRRVSEEHRRHRSLGLLLGRLAQAGLVLVGLLVALAIAVPSFKPAQVIQLLGITGVAIGFAFKDIFQNFLAGVLILLTEPFRLGDQIVFKGFEGTVEDIQTRATTIKTYDGRRVVIPNAELFTNSVVVNTAFDSRRSEYDVGIGYGDDIEKARRLILGVLKGTEGVLEDPAPDVIVVELAASSVNLRARWWSKPKKGDVLEVQDRVITAVKNTLTEHGIDLPFPTQQVLFHDQTEETDGDRRRQREGWPAGDGDAAPPPRPIAGALRRLAFATARGDEQGGAQPGDGRS
jgi:small-conductance mechanosensitive channel